MEITSDRVERGFVLIQINMNVVTKNYGCKRHYGCLVMSHYGLEIEVGNRMTDLNWPLHTSHTPTVTTSPFLLSVRFSRDLFQMVSHADLSHFG